MKRHWQWTACTVLGVATTIGCVTAQPSAQHQGMMAKDLLQTNAASSSKPSWRSLFTQNPSKKTNTSTSESNSAADEAPHTKGDPQAGQLATARLLERRDELVKARQMYEEYLQSYPNDALALHRLGVISARQGDFTEADRWFQKAIEQQPQDVDLLSDVAYTYYLDDRLEEAEGLLRNALQINPRHEASINNLGLVLGMQGRFEESLTMFRQVNDDAEAQANLAFVQTQLGDLTRAQESYSLALRMNENLRPAANAMLELAKHDQLQRSVAASKARRSHDTKVTLPESGASSATHLANIETSVDASGTSRGDLKLVNAELSLENAVDSVEVSRSRIAAVTAKEKSDKRMTVATGSSGGQEPRQQSQARPAAPFAQDVSPRRSAESTQSLSPEQKERVIAAAFYHRDPVETLRPETVLTTLPSREQNPQGIASQEDGVSQTQSNRGASIVRPTAAINPVAAAKLPVSSTPRPQGPATFSFSDKTESQAPPVNLPPGNHMPSIPQSLMQPEANFPMRTPTWSGHGG